MDLGEARADRVESWDCDVCGPLDEIGSGVNDAINILNVVDLTEDLPEHGLCRGQVGTVVETPDPEVFEVEFSDEEGRAYASLALDVSQLLVLHYEPVETR